MNEYNKEYHKVVREMNSILTSMEYNQRCIVNALLEISNANTDIENKTNENEVYRINLQNLKNQLNDF